MAIALYAGSFDPITLGHLYIINQCADMFEKVIIGVAYNPDKKCFLPISERVSLIEECVKDMPKVEVCSYDGLTVDFAKEHSAKVLIRGLRNSADFEYETQLAQINSDLSPDITTVFLTSSPKYNHISSSAVRELISHKCNISKYVPQNVSNYFAK